MLKYINAFNYAVLFATCSQLRQTVY